MLETQIAISSLSFYLVLTLVLRLALLSCFASVLSWT
jgi:hypothetical protein